MVTPNNWTEGLALNAGKAPFSDVRRRRAVAYAVDRRALAGALGAIPTSHVLPPSSWASTRGPVIRSRPTCAPPADSWAVGV